MNSVLFNEGTLFLSIIILINNFIIQDVREGYPLVFWTF